MTSRAEGARVGGLPSSPARLSLGDWRAAFANAFREFLADDCLGLAQQIAYSSLLAFFPAMNLPGATKVRLVGEFLDTMARSFDLVPMGQHAEAIASRKRLPVRSV